MLYGSFCFYVSLRNIFIIKDVPPSASSAAKQEKTDITDGAKDEDENEANANCPHKEPKYTLQALFSLLREEFERMDLRVLPLCLHQVLRICPLISL